jgi:hypothetical protein
MAALEGQARRLEAGAAAIQALGERLEAGAPWPLAELYGTEAEASWGPPELLAHLDEMLPFWLGEVERILEADPAGGPFPFGRVGGPDDVLRIGIIGRDRRLPIRELLARLGADSRRAASRMRELTDAETERLGLRESGESISAADIFERFVVGHIEDHVKQLTAILAAAGR